MTYQGNKLELVKFAIRISHTHNVEMLVELGVGDNEYELPF